jgi:chromosomal replication initiation ATPase DnaA
MSRSSMPVISFGKQSLVMATCLCASKSALKRVLAYCRFNNAQVSVVTAREALKDLLAVLNRQVSIENIQKTVAEYFKF